MSRQDKQYLLFLIRGRGQVSHLILVFPAMITSLFCIAEVVDGRSELPTKLGFNRNQFYPSAFPFGLIDSLMGSRDLFDGVGMIRHRELTLTS